MDTSDRTAAPTLDVHQLRRIEAVHRGFLYQHLYAVACLLSAQAAGVRAIAVERDEDIELVLPNRRIYVQVKNRSAPLTATDISGTLQRFQALGLEHKEERREGRAVFVIAANIHPGSALLKSIEDAHWPPDVTICWPDNPFTIDKSLPAPQPNIPAALAQCVALAATLPYALLAPETLVWKLAGMVTAAAAGIAKRADHSFQTVALPALFEQMVVQLQDFPAPPPVYRSHANEPPLQAGRRIRIIAGYSGSGKTSWISQAALHASSRLIYYDVIETPGPALTASIAREVAARLFGKTGGHLGEILLPGATGAELLFSIGKRLETEGEKVTIVLDNAHRVTPIDLQTLLKRATHFNFILLCQPGRDVTELEALLAVKAETLEGWPIDSIAAEIASNNCIGDYSACQRLINLTAGMPLFVQNAISIAKAEYAGSISRFCDDLEARTHTSETAQGIILERVFLSLPDSTRNAIAVLSLSDIPLDRAEAGALLMGVLQVDEKGVGGVLRLARSSGNLEVFGDNRLKVHDALRLIGRNHLALDPRMLLQSQMILKNVLAVSLLSQWDISKLSLYLRMLVAVGDIKTLVQLATDELFHELGFRPEILAFLETTAASKATDPEHRFWALDGLFFADLKRGDVVDGTRRQEAMIRLLTDHGLGLDERLAYAMKRMNLQALKRDASGVENSIKEISQLLPDTPQHQRILRYNAAHALFSLEQYDGAIEETGKLVIEYYDLLGIRPENILGRNPDQILPLLRKTHDLSDHLKHLADCLNLQASAISATGGISPFGRIHAMKFYQLASAPDSVIRVGQDLVDEFIEHHDFIGARAIIETHLLPNVLKLKMLARIVPVRSQYAVVLAYCGDFEAADAEMKRLAPYEVGLNEQGKWELRNQRKLIAQLRVEGPPPQWLPPEPRAAKLPQRKIGRNEQCPCGSGKKYKRCHG